MFYSKRQLSRLGMGDRTESLHFSDGADVKRIAASSQAGAED